MENKFPSRKPIRLQNFDYSSDGAYFITICTKDKQHILGNIVGATNGRPYETKLSKYGEIVNEAILKIPEFYNNIIVDKYVIMPNHIHLILVIESNSDKRPMVAPTVSRVIKQMKGYATKQINNGYGITNIWQRSFHDHIIRGEKDYLEILDYIDTNPQKWTLDKYYNGIEMSVVQN